MRRVAVTGLGIVSSLGNNAEEVTDSLRKGKSGITLCEEYKEMGLHKQAFLYCLGRPLVEQLIQRGIYMVLIVSVQEHSHDLSKNKSLKRTNA